MSARRRRSDLRHVRCTSMRSDLGGPLGEAGSHVSELVDNDQNRNSFSRGRDFSTSITRTCCLFEQHFCMSILYEMYMNNYDPPSGLGNGPSPAYHVKAEAYSNHPSGSVGGSIWTFYMAPAEPSPQRSHWHVNTAGRCCGWREKL